MRLDINPLRQGLPREKAIDPCAFVIFGGTGDLARRKLLPALYRLYAAGLLPRGFAMVGYAHKGMNDEEYRAWAEEAIAKASPPIKTEGRTWEGFRAALHFCPRTDEMGPSLVGLKRRIEEADAGIGSAGNYVFYFAIPPAIFASTADGLREVGLAHDETGRGWRRIVIEKPFGEDLESACRLNAELLGIFREDQIYRIDHYLGKETVQNILVFRFANQFIEPLLNSRYVDHIQITVAETVGVEKRGGYYDSAGALRDMVQNHIMQVMALTCMEPPHSLESEAVREEKVKLLRSVRPIDPPRVDEVAARGQYRGGQLMGETAPDYREEEGVADDSATETFAALKLFIDNWRWEGVPVYIRTGKRLAKRVSEVAIHLKDVPRILFGETHREVIEPNVIALTIQPDEGASIRFEAKVPGLAMRLQPVRMDFRYGTAFGPSVPEAYERLLLDIMRGDQSLFTRADGVEAAWRIVEPVLQAWRSGGSRPGCYTAGSWGPDEAVEIMEQDGRRWRRL